MVKLAEAYPVTFLRTSREFLLRKDFMREDGVIRDDSWGTLCDNFQTYERWADDRAKSVAERYRLERERDEQARKQRRDDFLSVLNIPHEWKGLTETDREWVEAVRVRQEAPGEVSDADVKRSDQLRGRCTSYHYFAGDGVRPTVLSKYLLDQLETMPGEWRESQTWLNLWHQIADEEDVDELKALANKVWDMLAKRAEEPPYEGPGPDEPLADW